jgi:hypothetical protein
MASEVTAKPLAQPLLLLGGTDPVGRFIIEHAAPQRLVIVVGRS